MIFIFGIENSNVLRESQELGNQQLIKEYKAIFSSVNNRDQAKVVNIGLLKAGKSSLFSALAGDEIFKSGVVRTTTENQIYSLNQFDLVDTPGLDANEGDSRIAFEGYMQADLFIFVHHALDGELGQVEIDELDKILALFPKKEDFFNSTFFVLTHEDQCEENVVTDLLQRINKQCENYFRCSFREIMATSSENYLKGIREGKVLLQETSNIFTLRSMIETYISEKNSAASLMYLKRLTQVSENIQKKLQLMDKHSDNEDMNNLKKQIDKSKANLEKIKQIEQTTISNLPRTIPKVDISIPYVSERDYRSYESHYQAKRAAEQELERGIKTMIAEAKSEGGYIVNKLESYAYLRSSGDGLRETFTESYTKIKELYYDCVKQKSLKPFKLEYKQLAIEPTIVSQVERAHERITHVGDISFKSVDYYLKNYETNLWIDYEYEEKCVSGLFGDRWKQVKVYNWEMKGAIEDLQRDFKSVVSERAFQYYKEFNQIYDIYLNEWIKQYEEQILVIKRELMTYNNKLIAQENEILRSQDLIKEEFISLKKIKSMTEDLMEEIA